MQRHAPSFLLWLSLVFFASTASAADYFVSPRGDDADAGTSEAAPWQTIAKANGTVSPGDVVHLRDGTYIDDPIRPSKSGTAAKPIKYLAYRGETPVLTSDRARGLEVAIDLSGRSHVEVVGVHVDGEQPNPKARVDHFVEIVGGSYNTISDCTFRYAHGWSGITLDGGAHHNRILNNVVDVVGIYDDGNGQDWGDTIQVSDAEHNLVQGNVFTRGAHNLMQVKGRYNVIRENTFDNDWSEMLGAGKGGRNLSLMGKYNLFEKNIVRNAGRSTDTPANAGKKAEGEGNIVRRNFIYDNSNEGITSQSRGGSKVARENHIYHNTIFSNGGPAWGLIFYKGGDGVTANVFKNNIVYANRSDAGNGGGDLLFKLGSNPSGVVGDSLIEGNLIAKQSPGDATIEVQEAGGVISLEQAEQQYAKNIKGNIQADPTFVAAHPQKAADFELRPGSRGIDEAAPLTRTRGKGSGTVVPLEDAGYFSDGFSVMFGDRVQIGDGRPMRIMKVDYSANTITVAEPTRWDGNAPVSLEFRGAAPDIGAHEAGLASARPKAPGGLSGRAL